MLSDIEEVAEDQGCLIAPAEEITEEETYGVLLFRCRGEQVVVTQARHWLGFRCVSRGRDDCEELIGELAPAQAVVPASMMVGRGSG